MRNEDRTLTQCGGNPNLLWNAGTSDLTVIDHNLIFASDFNKDIFWDTHAFKDQFINSQLDLLDHTNYLAKMEEALKGWSTAWDTLPEEWVEESEELQTIDKDALFQQLEKDAQGEIWTQLR